ncbi:MAG: hypothetical protein P4L40_12110 [Terracidiphilus sp.]|nr:hypothetical protein [Terracidiphilus sp.]
MRRYLALVFLISLAVPAGISISGCTRNPAANYCNGLGYGPKIGDVNSIDLEPRTTGLSLAWGQTRQISAPTAKDCKENTASVSGYTYGTTDTTRKYVDVTPSGSICAGSWNRNSGGGISDYTICTPPNPEPTTNGLPYTSAYITASANSVTSNPVQVFVHAAVSSIALSTSGTTSGTGCYSQNVSAQLDAEACYASNGTQYEFCAPSTVTKYSCAGGLASGVSSVPSCSTAIGTLSYSVGTTSVASIDSETNIITAKLPGTTAITATVAQSGASAGYFSTCPAKSISLAFSNGSTSGAVTQGVTQNLKTTVLDTTGASITGLSLDYQSTNLKDVSVGSTGAISATFPGAASVYAVCQPSTCNPAPVNQIGVGSGTGLPLASNAVSITVPGTATTYLWLSAPGQSQYFVPISLLTGTSGSTIKLPYVPNSMVLDRTGTNLYFGSSTELMVYSTSSNTLSKQITATPGVVLAVSPDNSTVLVNDPVRKVFYVYGASSSTVTTTFGGLGASATWTPDSKTLYIVDSASLGSEHTNTLYVYNANTGWTTQDLTSSGGATNLALTSPSVGAYLSGNPTVAHTWCPTGTAGDYASMSFYPQGDSVDVLTDVLAGTMDGNHVIGASLNSGTVTLSDIGVTVPTTQCPIATDGTMTALALSHTLVQTPVSINATSLNDAITAPSPVSSGTSVAATSLTFLTYNGTTTGATLPYYQQATSATTSLGTLGYVTLTGASSITAPVAGVFSPDDTIFFVSTAGDNLVHMISTKTLTDTQQITPALPACTVGDADCTLTATPASGIVPATALQVKPRSTT